MLKKQESLRINPKLGDLLYNRLSLEDNFKMKIEPVKASNFWEDCKVAVKSQSSLE